MERLLWIVTVDGPSVPARLCSLLAKRSVAVTGLQMVREPDVNRWSIHLSVSVESERELILVIDRLHRLVDVVTVLPVGSGTDQLRRPIFVTLRPDPTDMSRVCEIATLFSAEVIELTSAAATLHLSATNDQCTQFLAVLEPYGVVDVIRGAMSGVRGASSSDTCVPSRVTDLNDNHSSSSIPFGTSRRRA